MFACLHDRGRVGHNSGACHERTRHHHGPSCSHHDNNHDGYDDHDLYDDPGP